MGVVLDTVGKWLASYLQKEVPGYEPFTPSDPDRLRNIVQPGDVLLVEGNNRISGIIKYLTQSTWSHAALFVGPIDGAEEPPAGVKPTFIPVEQLLGGKGNPGGPRP